MPDGDVVSQEYISDYCGSGSNKDESWHTDFEIIEVHDVTVMADGLTESFGCCYSLCAE